MLNYEWVCDICGAASRQHLQRKLAMIELTDSYFDNGDTMPVQTRYDACAECFEAMKKFLQERKGNEFHDTVDVGHPSSGHSD